MTWLFSKDNVNQIYKQFEKTKQNLEGTFEDIDKLYQLVFDAYSKKSELEHHYKIISDATREAIILTIDSVIIEANKAAYSIIGYASNQDQLLGKKVTEIIFEKDHKILSKHFNDAQSYVCEVRVIHKVGYLVPVEVQSREIEYNREKARITTCLDISKRKEEEIKRKDIELELKKTKAHLGTLLLKRGYITQRQLQDGLSFQDDLPRRLGNILVKLGYVTQEELLEALTIQEENRLGNILIRKNFITQKQLEEVLSQQESEFSTLGLHNDL